MNYKVAFINPKTKNIIDTEPLNIATIATYLRKSGINAKIIDELAGDDVIKEVDNFKPDLVGFTAATCSYPRALQLLRAIKPKGYLTIIGGVHASTMPQRAIEDGFDMAVVGEGEKMLLDIITKGERKGIFRTTREQILKSEEIPLPDRTLINMDFYRRTKDRSPQDSNLDFIPFGANIACMMTSRGCPYNCIFCHNTWRGTPIRLLKPELIIEEIENLIRNYDVHHLWLIDDDFFQNKRRSMEFCNLVIQNRLEIYWATSARPDSVDEEVLEMAYRAGCRRISFGFESGSQRILDILNKRSNVEKNIAAANMCNKYNIEVCGLFMIGNPTETKEDIKLTWQFIKKTKLDSIAINVTTPFPGTQLWKYCEDKGYIPSNVDFSNFYFTKAPIQVADVFTPKQIENIKIKLLIKIYLFHPKIRNRFMIKAAHHPLLMVEKVFDYIPFIKKGAT